MKKLKEIVWIPLFFVIGFLAGPVPAQASEMDILLNKLVEKGILTEQEGREIRSEVKAEARQQAQAHKAEVRQEVSEALEAEIPERVASGKMPDWLRNTQWFGDVRVRYEGQFRTTDDDRHRERVRVRVGFRTQPVEQMEVGVRLATGGRGAPTSTNQTLTDTFDQKDFGLDRAYLKYSPWKSLKVIAGKMANPFRATDIVWDGDVTPEGAAIQWTCPKEGPVRPFANLGVFRIDELSGDAGDPGLLGFQLGAETDVPGTEDWTLTPSVAYYDFTGIAGRTASTITNAPNGNSTLFNGAFRDDFDLVNLIAELKIPSSAIFGQPITLLGDLVVNTAADDDETAWQTGFQVGKITEKFGSWKAFYYYKRLESDATFGAITDGDFGTGRTGHVGHKFGARIGLKKNWDVGLIYFRVDEDEASGGSTARRNILQIESLVKF